ncbi:MAG: ferric iron uptake transcriptional regulator [Gammaproteobacteria bacterium]|nr:ferric iron uptake transcriptional regulator [Gammaproteobacteria bacterium]MYJ52521.1 ferric iron uptake transcriptional regulator [Gammaproteobacteria bacterium]
MDGTDLQQAGIKPTLPRLKILSILENSTTRHLTVEDVYRELMEQDAVVGMATIYRVLTQFVEAGLVIRHNFEGEKSVFELNDGDHHYHMICVRCGKVIEFHSQVIEQEQQQVAESHEFVIQDHSLTLYGTCRRCAPI